MSEEQKTSDEVPAEEATSSEILDELQALGAQLATTVKSLWESEESRKLRQEIGDGFVELGQQIDTAVKSAQESEPAKQFSDQVKETVEQARQSDVVGKVQEGLLTGLRELNSELSKMVSSLEPKEEAEAEPEAEPEE
jgi:phage-related protein